MIKLEYSLAKIKIPTEWNIKRNVFYDIDPLDEISEDDKFDNIYYQEDLLWIQKGDLNIDLGWYGGEDSSAGFCIVFYKGKSWNDCELFEVFRSRNKNTIIKRLEFLVDSVINGLIDSKNGYVISESKGTDISDFETYSVFMYN